MATYLLTWNPARGSADLEYVHQEFLELGFSILSWSMVANKAQVELDDHVLLLRQGKPPRGVIAAGVVTELPYEEGHFDDDVGGLATYVGVEITEMVANPLVDCLDVEDLKLAAPNTNWHPQSSGTQVREADEDAVWLMWERYLEMYPVEHRTTLPKSADASDEEYFEGHYYVLLLEAVERNAKAREAAIAHYGCRCVACGFDFEATYGKAGRGFIEVHHLNPIRSRGGSHKMDPVRDLRPVCSNCHSIVHRRTPPYSPDAVKAMLKRR